MNGQNGHASARTSGSTCRLVVMVSGGGRTLAGLHAATVDGRLNGRIVGVISSTPAGSAGYERALSLGLPVVWMEGHLSADVFAHQVESCGADLVVLAGYLKKVPVPAGWAGRIVNIHPGLLPRFGGHGLYGRRVHEAVLAAGVTESGCTVHLVDEEYDRGPTLLERRCPVLAGDTPETLGARVFALEQEAYVTAIAGLLGAGLERRT